MFRQQARTRTSLAPISLSKLAINVLDLSINDVDLSIIDVDLIINVIDLTLSNASQPFCTCFTTLLSRASRL